MAAPRPTGGPPPQVLQWLHRVVAPEYKDPQRTYSDVAMTLATLPTLSPRTSVYTHENGKSELLVNLSGTFPVIFRGSIYNIPISIWVPHQYPKQPPIAFVIPAKGMMIRPGNHVDLAGKCYHPYLANWIHYHDRSNIVDLCDVLRSVFGREPPVMAIQTAPPPPQEPATPPPRPPLPPELAPKSPSPPVHPQGPPPLPPLPKGFTGDRHGPANDPRRHSMPHPVPQHPLRQQQSAPPPPPPPPPPHPGHAGIMGHHAHSPQYGLGPAAQVQHGAGPPLGPQQVRGSPVHPPQQPPPPFQQQRQQQQQQQSYYQTGPPPPPLPQKPHSPPPPPTPQQQPHFPPPHPLSYQGYRPAQPPAPPKPAPPKPVPAENLLDSPPPPPVPQSADPSPPPPPPNPERDLLITRIATHLHSLAEANHAQTTAALAGAAAQRAALHTATASLEREQHELRHIETVCDSDVEILRERIAMAESVIQECRSRELPDVDSMVVAGSVVETQLYDLVAADMAIEDTIYVLGKALDRERISLDVFLKHARTLAREQFLKRALIRKISEELRIE